MKIKTVFYSLLVTFALIVTYFIFPRRELFPIVAVLSFIFFILGIVLVYLSWKSKLNKKLKIFLIMTGASASGFLLSVLLHNFVYALMVTFIENFTGDEALFFIIALFVCPITFLIGAAGSIIMFRKRKK